MQDPDDKETKNDWEISEEDFQRFYKAIKHLAKTYVVDMTKGNRPQRSSDYYYEAALQNQLTIRRIAKAYEKFDKNWDVVILKAEDEGIRTVWNCQDCLELYGRWNRSKEKCLICKRPLLTLKKFAESIKQLKEVLEEDDLECHDVFPDGNCLFAAVVDQLLIRGVFHISASNLRKTVVQYLRKHPISHDGTPYECFLSSESWETYLSRMALNDEHTDHIILNATADVLQTTIVVYRGTEGMEKTVITPNKKCLEEHFKICVAFIDVSHYVSLRPRNWRRNVCKDPGQLFGIRRSTTSNPNFPAEVINLPLRVVFRSDRLKSFDQHFVETFSATSFKAKCFDAVMVGSYVNMMLPNTFSGEEEGSFSSLLNQRSNKETIVQCWFYIPDDIWVTEQKTVAGKYDLIVQGDLLKGQFSLVPKQPKAWGQHVRVTDENCVLLHIDAEGIDFVREYAKPLTENSGLTNCNVIAFSIKWPDCAEEWFQRTRPSGILSKGALKTIERIGCHAVPCQHDFDNSELMSNSPLQSCGDTDAAWSLSFAVAEKEYCRFLTKDQKLCFLLFRCFLHETVIGHKVPQCIASHVFFYACDNIQRADWKDFPGKCFFILLKRLLDNCKRHFSPHYFIREKNLLEYFEAPVLCEISETLSCNLSNPILAIYKALAVCDIINTDFGTLVKDICLEATSYLLNDSGSIGFIEYLVPSIARNIKCMITAGEYEKAVVFLQAFDPLNNRSFVGSFAQYIKNQFDEHLLWSICVYLDMRAGTNITEKAFCDVPCIHISEVFGENANDLILDTCIPERAAVAFGDLRYAQALKTILKRNNMDLAIIECLTFYLRKYIELAAEDITLSVVDGHYFRSLSVMGELYELHIGLYNACFHFGQVETYREFFKHLKQVVIYLNTDYHYKNFKIVANGLGIID